MPSLVFVPHMPLTIYTLFGVSSSPTSALLLSFCQFLTHLCISTRSLVSVPHPPLHLHTLSGVHSTHTSDPLHPLWCQFLNHLCTSTLLSQLLTHICTFTPSLVSILKIPATLCTLSCLSSSPISAPSHPLWCPCHTYLRTSSLSLGSVPYPLLHLNTLYGVYSTHTSNPPHPLW